MPNFGNSSQSSQLRPRVFKRHDSKKKCIRNQSNSALSGPVKPESATALLSIAIKLWLPTQLFSSWHFGAFRHSRPGLSQLVKIPLDPPDSQIRVNQGDVASQSVERVTSVSSWYWRFHDTKMPLDGPITHSRPNLPVCPNSHDDFGRVRRYFASNHHFLGYSRYRPRIFSVVNQPSYWMFARADAMAVSKVVLGTSKFFSTDFEDFDSLWHPLTSFFGGLLAVWHVWIATLAHDWCCSWCRFRPRSTYDACTKGNPKINMSISGWSVAEI